MVVVSRQMAQIDLQVPRLQIDYIKTLSEISIYLLYEIADEQVGMTVVNYFIFLSEEEKNFVSVH